MSDLTHIAKPPDAPWRLAFHQGTLELHAPKTAQTLLGDLMVWDDRTHCYRARAISYADLVITLKKAGQHFIDEARAYRELTLGVKTRKTPRPYQKEALDAWIKVKGRGVVVLPTGAGKTHMAVMAIQYWPRSALVIAPTLDLVRQWYDVLKTTFDAEVGVVGGGSHEVRDLTVSTYDSAYLHMAHFGHRFGLVVFDECHHLPSASYAFAAESCLAPFRLGLTATPERTDGLEMDLARLIGPTVYRRDIVELSGEYLADYDTEQVAIALSPEERAEYESERAVYVGFVRSQDIQLGGPSGWREFIMATTRSKAGQRAMQAYRRQREIAFAAPGKLAYVGHLLDVHRRDKTIIFTQDNATVYALSRRYLIPAITHQTKIKERSEILAGLSQGHYTAVVTSKVLNEGVDVPDANVAIVVSGSGSVREHVQRLGRILRKKGDKYAKLYELVSADTSERWTSERRREHVAYR